MLEVAVRGISTVGDELTEHSSILLLNGSHLRDVMKEQGINMRYLLHFHQLIPVRFVVSSCKKMLVNLLK